MPNLKYKLHKRNGVLDDTEVQSLQPKRAMGSQLISEIKETGNTFCAPSVFIGRISGFGPTIPSKREIYLA